MLTDFLLLNIGLQNAETLKHWTRANVRHNSAMGDAHCSYMAGDWAVLVDAHTQFDTLLMSETIYNIHNYAALHRLLQVCATPTANM
jgi:hypothetical protein